MLYHERAAFSGLSEAVERHQHGRQQQEEAQDNEHQDELPDPADPLGVGYAGDAEDGDENAGDGGNHVGETVAELECEDGGLAGESD